MSEAIEEQETVVPNMDTIKRSMRLDAALSHERARTTTGQALKAATTHANILQAHASTDLELGRAGGYAECLNDWENSLKSDDTRAAAVNGTTSNGAGTQNSRLVQNMAMLIRRLARRLGTWDKGHRLAREANGFLIRHNLQGSILREGSAQPSPARQLTDIDVGHKPREAGGEMDTDRAVGLLCDIYDSYEPHNPSNYFAMHDAYCSLAKHASITTKEPTHG